MQLLYQAGQVGKTMARKPEGVYTDQGVLVPFSAVQLQTTFASELDDVSNFGATGTQVGSLNAIDPGSGPFGAGSLYFASGAAFPYQDYSTFNRLSQQGLGGAIEFTIDAWIKPESGRPTTSRGIVGQLATTITNSQSQYILYTNGLSGSQVGLVFQIHRGTTNSFSTSVSSTTSGCLVNQWNHIRLSVRLNPSTGLQEYRWYINGTYKTSVSVGDLPTYETANTVPHQVGITFRGTGSDTRFPGWIGPLRVIKGYSLNNVNANITIPTTYFPVY